MTGPGDKDEMFRYQVKESSKLIEVGVQYIILGGILFRTSEYLGMERR